MSLGSGLEEPPHTWAAEGSPRQQKKKSRWERLCTCTSGLRKRQQCLQAGWWTFWQKQPPRDPSSTCWAASQMDEDLLNPFQLETLRGSREEAPVNGEWIAGSALSPKGRRASVVSLSHRLWSAGSIPTTSRLLWSLGLASGSHWLLERNRSISYEERSRPRSVEDVND